jgi:hypothetical protein
MRRIYRRGERAVGHVEAREMRDERRERAGGEQPQRHANRGAWGDPPERALFHVRGHEIEKREDEQRGDESCRPPPDPPHRGGTGTEQVTNDADTREH